jgi:hypothetical protein
LNECLLKENNTSLKLVDKGFNFFVDNDRLDDLKKMFMLLSRLDARLGYDVKKKAEIIIK